MAEQELVNVIKWRDDPASQKVLERIQQLTARADALQKRLDALRTQTAALSKGYSNVDRAGAGTATVLEEQAASAQRAERQLRRLNDTAKDTSLDQLRQDALDADRALDELAKPRTVTINTNKAALEQARQYGDVETPVRAITGAVGYVGGTGFEHIANVGAELLAVNEAAGLLRVELPKLSTQLTSQGTLTRAAVQALQDYVPGMDAAAASTTVAVGSLGAMAAATVAIGVAAKVAQGIINDSKKATEGLIDVNQRYAEVIATGTREDVEAAIQANEDRNKALEIERQKLDEFVQQAQGLDGVSGTLVDLNDALGTNLGGYEDVKNRLAEVNQELGNNTDLNNQLSQALKDGATAINDMRSATDALLEERKAESQQVLEDVNRSVNFAADLRELIASGSVDEVTQEIDRLTAARDMEQRRIEQISAAYLSGSITSEDSAIASAAARKEIEVLNGQISDLTLFAIPAAEANDRVATSLERTTELSKARHDALQAEAEATQQAVEALVRAGELTADYAQTTADNEAKRTLQSTRDEADYQRQRARDIAAHYQELAELDAAYYDDVAETLAGLSEDVAEIDQDQVQELADQNKTLQRMAKDHATKMRQLQRDLDLSEQDAVEDRDVSAAIQAARQAQEQATSENEQYEEEKERREEDFADRLKELDAQRAETLKRGQQALQDLKTQHQKERQQQITAFNAEITRQDQENAIKLQRQKEDYANEDALRKRHFDEQISDYSGHFEEIGDIVAGGLSTLKTNVQSAVDWLTSATQSLAVSGSSSAKYVSGTGRTKAYGTGGRVTPNQWVITGDTGTELAKFNRDGSWDILNPRQTQQVLSQPSVSLSVPVQIFDASSPTMIESIFEQRVMPKLIQAAQQVAASKG